MEISNTPSCCTEHIYQNPFLLCRVFARSPHPFSPSPSSWVIASCCRHAFCACYNQCHVSGAGMSQTPPPRIQSPSALHTFFARSKKLPHYAHSPQCLQGVVSYICAGNERFCWACLAIVSTYLVKIMHKFRSHLICRTHPSFCFLAFSRRLKCIAIYRILRCSSTR